MYHTVMPYPVMLSQIRKSLPWKLRRNLCHQGASKKSPPLKRLLTTVYGNKLLRNVTVLNFVVLRYRKGRYPMLAGVYSVDCQNSETQQSAF